MGLTSSIRNRVLFVIALLAALIVGDRLVGFALERVILSSEFRYSRLYRGDVDADIVVIGNSRALHAIYAPDASAKLNKRVFNASYNGLDTTTVATLVEDYLRYNDPPETIVVEITGLTVPPGQAFDLYAMYYGRSPGFRDQLREYLPKRALGCDLSHIFRANGPMFSHVLRSLTRNDQDWITPASVVVPAYLLEREVTTEDATEFDRTNLASFARIVEACDDADVKLVPLISPYAPGVLGDRDVTAKYRAAIERVALDCPPIADYSRALDDTAAFADRIHTNRRGADALLDRLISDGVLAP